MLKISEKTDLGIFFLLTVAQEEGASVADVAKRWKFVSSGYLEEVVAALRRGGLVLGKKGRGGGYTLAQSPASITILDVVRSVDGPLALVETPVHTKMRSSTFEGWCVSRRLWGRLQQGVEAVLKEITLADLVKEGTQFATAKRFINEATKQENKKTN